MAERSVEVILRHLEEGWRRPQQDLRLGSGLERGRILAREEARLQLADPIPAFGQRQTRIALQMLLKSALVEPLVVEGAELRGQAAQSPDETELRGDDVDDKTEAALAREVEPVLGFALHLAERVSGGKKIGVQVVAAVRRKGQVADLVCGIEGATHQIAAGLDVLRPGHDEIPEGHVGAGLIAMQSALAPPGRGRACRIGIRPR